MFAKEVSPLELAPPCMVGAEIFVSIKSVYGSQQIYPVCANAKTFAVLAGTKTLTPQAIGAIKDLGVKVNVVPSTPAVL